MVFALGMSLVYSRKSRLASWQLTRSAKEKRKREREKKRRRAHLRDMQISGSSLTTFQSRQVRKKRGMRRAFNLANRVASIAQLSWFKLEREHCTGP